jgi:phage gp29-like protein
VKAASDDQRDQDIAKDVRENIAEHDGFADLVEDMLDALGKGYSQTEIIWKRSSQKWRIERFDHIDPRFFVFDRETGQEIRLLDEQEPVHGVPLVPYKWISHRAKLKSGLVFRGGLARLVAFGHLCKSYSVKDWVAFVETYGLPFRLWRYCPDATPEDVEVLFRAVANIGTDAAAVLPLNMQIDFQQIAAGPGNDIFEKFARWCDEQTSKAGLGQTMTSDNGSSQAQAKVHNEVRHDIAQADAKGVCGTLNRDLVKPYVDLHYGPQERYPKIWIEIEEVEDLDMVMKHTMAAVDRGLRVKQSELRAKLRYTEPDDDDELMTPAKAQGAAAPEPQARAENRADDHDHDPYAATDQIVDELGEDWEAVMADIVGPVTDLLSAADSYEEAQRLLADAFPAMNSRRLIGNLISGSVRSRALGDRNG